MTIISPAAAYTRGHAAYRREGCAAICPFGMGTPQRREWHKGYRNALDFERDSKPIQLDFDFRSLGI